MPRQTIAPIWLIMVFLGLLAAGLGVWLAVGLSGEARQEAERIAHMRQLTAASIDDLPLGTQGLIEGRISARNPARFRLFVAYVREGYRGDDSDGAAQWEEEERQTPPLLVDLPDGPVQIGNTSYRMENMGTSWQETQQLTWDSRSGESTKRYRGFEAGQTVLALGRLARGSEGRVLDAELLYFGTRKLYIERQRDLAFTLPWIGGAVIALGSLFVVLGGWLTFAGIRQRA